MPLFDYVNLSEADQRDPVRYGVRAVFLAFAFVPWLSIYLGIYDMVHEPSDEPGLIVLLILTIPLSFFLTVVGLIHVRKRRSQSQPIVFWCVATALAAGPWILVAIYFAGGFDLGKYVHPIHNSNSVFGMSYADL